MMHGFQQIITQAERCDNFVVHGLPPLGDAMGVVPLIWRKKLLDSISGNLGYVTCNNLFSPKELSANGGSISPILNGGRRRLLQGGFRKPRLNPEFMNRLDEYTKIVTEHLTEDLIQLSDIALTADGI